MARFIPLAALTLAAGALAATGTTGGAATVSPIVHALAATETELSGDINFSMINKPITVPEIPNCSTSGTLSLLAGGFDANDSDLDIAMSFFNTGFLRFQANGMAANVSLDLGLLSGAQNTDFKIPLFSKDLLSLPLGGLANIDVGFQINVPVSALLNSEADIFSGFLLSVPDGSSLQLDVGDPSNSYLSGFDEATLTPLPLDANIPNLNFSALTGLEFVLTANSSSNGALSGNVAATLHLPTLHTTAKPVNNVNSACEQVQGSDVTYTNAVNVAWDAQMDLDMVGQIDVDIAGFTDSWAPNFQVLDFSFPLPTQCLKWDPVETGLVAVTNTISAPTAVQTVLTSSTAVPAPATSATPPSAASGANGAASVGIDHGARTLMVVLTVLTVLASAL